MDTVLRLGARTLQCRWPLCPRAPSLVGMHLCPNDTVLRLGAYAVQEVATVPSLEMATVPERPPQAGEAKPGAE
eukprot:scaffold21825_cov17-Tisochrysis_lutea.AAC.1